MGDECVEEQDMEASPSMWPEEIKDKSRKQFNIEKPSGTEETILKERKQNKGESRALDFTRLAELTDYSDNGSYQLNSLVKQYKYKKANACRLLQEELDSLSKERREIELKKLEILEEHRFDGEKRQVSILQEEGVYDIWGNGSTLKLKNNDVFSYDEKFETYEEYGTVQYWRERAVRLERLLEESLRRERVLMQKLRENVNKSLEEQNSLPVEELSQILKRADNFLHFILQNAPVVIAHQDKDLRYRFIYNHFPSLDEQDIIGKTDDEILMSCEGVKEFLAFKREVLENGKAAKREIIYETPLFGKKTFMTFVEPVFTKEKEVIGVNYIGMDITDQVAKREKWAKIREMQAVQKAKETELQRSIHITEETMRAKQMLATMSHEIRSPLTGVVSMAEILATTKMDKEQRQLLEVMLSSGDLVLQLINDILDLSKVESGAMKLGATKFRPREVVKHVLQTAVASLKKDLTLEGHVADQVPLEVVGDVLRIRQILTNLISNAVKFTHDGKVGIKLHVVSTESPSPPRKGLNCNRTGANPSFCDNDQDIGENSQIYGETVWLQCDVYDTGIGIPEKALPSLFKRYMQASTDHARKYGGTGLGLAICKQLVELMGGNLTVVSEEHKGSTFTFTIPCNVPVIKQENSDDPDDVGPVCQTDKMEGFFLFKPKLVSCDLKANAVSDEAGPARQRPEQNGSKRDVVGRVLLVEDNKVNIIVGKNMVEQLGHRVDIVNNGLEAIRAIQCSHYDLILMDVNMPVMDGLETTRLIRSFEETGQWDTSVGPASQMMTQHSAVPHSCPNSTRRRKRIPIIAMTANAFGESGKECLASGMDSYISKPLTFQNLKLCLQHFLPCQTT